MAQNFKRNKKQVEEAKRKKRLEKANRRQQRSAEDSAPPVSPDAVPTPPEAPVA